MNDEQEKRVVEALVDFVLRVAKGNATNESEVAVLPLVAKELFEVRRELMRKRPDKHDLCIVLDKKKACPPILHWKGEDGWTCRRYRTVKGLRDAGFMLPRFASVLVLLLDRLYNPQKD